MNFLDLVVILTAATAGWLGYRLGFVRRALSWAGLVIGVVVAIAFVDDLADALRGAPPRTRLLASLAFVVLLATIGQGVGFALGSILHPRLGRADGVLRKSDRVAGAALGRHRRARVDVAVDPGAGQLTGMAGRARCATRRWPAPSTDWRPLRPTRPPPSVASSATRRSRRCSTPSRHPTPVIRPTAGSRSTRRNASPDRW